MLELFQDLETWGPHGVGEDLTVWKAACVVDSQGVGRLCSWSLQMSRVRCCSYAAWLVELLASRKMGTGELG